MTKMTTIALGALLAFLPLNARAQGNNPDQNLVARVQALETLTATLQNEVQTLKNLLSHFSRSGNEIFVTGANLHVVNGADTTDSVNGFGNIIIGYNEARVIANTLPNVRTGSHMLVVGSQLNYSQFGGIVAGFRNATSGPYSSVTGGFFNLAGGSYSSVTGGEGNWASGQYSSITGGSSSGASGQWSSVTGGYGHAAAGQYSSVTGGISARAYGELSSVTGGAGNSALGQYSSVTGGQQNTASGQSSSVTGGQSNTASGNFQNLP
jgi:hypothetical protein